MPRLSMKLLHSACDAYEHTYMLSLAAGSKKETQARRLQRAGFLMETGVSALSETGHSRAGGGALVFIHFVPTLRGLFHTGRLAHWPTQRRREPPTRNVKAG